MTPKPSLVANPLTHEVRLIKPTLELILKFVIRQNNNIYHTTPHCVADANACGFAFFDLGSPYIIDNENFEFFTKYGVLRFTIDHFSFHPYKED